MKRYKLIASYTETELKHKNVNDLEIVTVPMLTKNGQFEYGIEKVCNKLFETGTIPTDSGFDILALATLVYLADTRISRESHSQDSWTREISLELPVYETDKFAKTQYLFERMLNFLTGDKWTISFTTKESTSLKSPEDIIEQKKYDVASLFSGGMDSLISTINYLEQNKKVILLSHAGDGFTKNSQKNILQEFETRYPQAEPFYLDLWMVFEKDFLPYGGNENSTRSRSFLFIALGIFAISNQPEINVLQVPENGLIALNIPLDELRVGSHSTRTTHPFYLNLWNEVLQSLEMNKTVKNPYWNKTKGEMAFECLNKDHLFEIINKSISCSSPIKARWKKLPPQHCGYCVPCIIRRAAMHKAFGKGSDTTVYTAKDIFLIINNHAYGEGIQLRSFQYAIKRLKDNPLIANLLVYKTGAITGNKEYINDLADAYKRGLLEVDDFINSELVENNEDI